jgi:transcriptional regulator with XRE-family HTH domain
MANYSRWEDIKASKPAVDRVTAAEVRSDFELGQLIYDLRTRAGISQAELARRMDTSQSAVSRLEEGGGARNRLDTLARVARALGRHLVLSFPDKEPTDLHDAVKVA